MCECAVQVRLKGILKVVCELGALVQRQSRSYNGVMCWGSVYRAG